jgi:hypothetical protein
MKIHNPFVIILVLLFCLSSCTSSVFKIRSPDGLKNLGETDRIEIDVRKQDEEGVWVKDFTKTISDTKQINLITKTLQKYPDGWKGYMPYLPGRLTVEFYAKEELIIPIIVVSYANTSGGLSYFLSRPAGPARPIKESEFKELMKLLEIDEDLAYFSDMKISTE